MRYGTAREGRRIKSERCLGIQLRDRCSFAFYRPRKAKVRLKRRIREKFFKVNIAPAEFYLVCHDRARQVQPAADGHITRRHRNMSDRLKIERLPNILKIECQRPCRPKIGDMKERQERRHIGGLNNRSFRFDIQCKIYWPVKVSDASPQFDFRMIETCLQPFHFNISKLSLKAAVHINRTAQKVEGWQKSLYVFCIHGAGVE